jgi:lipopolysaccharide export system permease protein
MNAYRESLKKRGVEEKDILKETTELTLRSKAEIHKKISFSFATFCFVLVGLPLAVITRRGEAVVSFTLSLAVVALYYALFIWGRTIAVNGYVAAWIALWIPNVLVVGSALFLMTKVIRL